MVFNVSGCGRAQSNLVCLLQKLWRVLDLYCENAQNKNDEGTRIKGATNPDFSTLSVSGPEVVHVSCFKFWYKFSYKLARNRVPFWCKKLVEEKTSRKHVGRPRFLRRLTSTSYLEHVSGLSQIVSITTICTDSVDCIKKSSLGLC